MSPGGRGKRVSSMRMPTGRPYSVRPPLSRGDRRRGDAHEAARAVDLHEIAGVDDGEDVGVRLAHDRDAREDRALDEAGVGELVLHDRDGIRVMDEELIEEPPRARAA